MKRLVVSIRDDLANAMEKLVGRTRPYSKGSHLVADALEEFLKNRFPELTQSGARTYSTVLWKLGLGYMIKRGPSPWIESRKKLGEWKLVDIH
jgi:Arc/MetJ-type ribon-helix-helix transcriptional regulator